MEAKPEGVYIALAIAVAAMAALLSGGLVLHSAMPAIASGMYQGRFPNGTTGVSVLVIGSPLMIDNLLLALSGNGFNESVQVNLGPYGAGAEQAQQGAVPRAPGNATNSSSMVSGSETYTATFTGLEPNSTYMLTLSGSARPYCKPGLACPQYIVRVYRHENVTTGAAGTLRRYVISAFGAFNQSYGAGNTTLPNITEFYARPECGTGVLGISMPVLVHNVSYITCAPGQRLLNFLLHSVNENGTITTYYYAYLPVVYRDQIPVIETVGVGELAGYTCRGESAYLEAANRNMGTALFKLVEGPPIPCPV